MKPDQIDMMNEQQLMVELRRVLLIHSELKMLVIDMQATIRANFNSSNSMLKQCEEDRKRLGI